MFVGQGRSDLAGNRAVLGAASIGDVVLDLELIGALTGLTGPALDDRLAVLERQQFLSLEAGRYVFAAPLVQQVVRAEGLTPGQVQGLRARAANALASRPDLESRALRAELLARSSPGARAFEEAIAVARAVEAEHGFDRHQLDEVRMLLRY